MLQLCLTSLRTERGLEAFNLVYGDKYKYSLSAWKKAVSLTAKETDLLDADNGAGGKTGSSSLCFRRGEVAVMCAFYVLSSPTC